MARVKFVASENEDEPEASTSQLSGDEGSSGIRQHEEHGGGEAGANEESGGLLFHGQEDQGELPVKKKKRASSSKAGGEGDGEGKGSKSRVLNCETEADSPLRENQNEIARLRVEVRALSDRLGLSPSELDGITEEADRLLEVERGIPVRPKAKPPVPRRNSKLSKPATPAPAEVVATSPVALVLAPAPAPAVSSAPKVIKPPPPSLASPNTTGGRVADKYKRGFSTQNWGAGWDKAAKAAAEGSAASAATLPAPPSSISEPPFEAIEVASSLTETPGVAPFATGDHNLPIDLALTTSSPTDPSLPSPTFPAISREASVAASSMMPATETSPLLSNATGVAPVEATEAQQDALSSAFAAPNANASAFNVPGTEAAGDEEVASAVPEGVLVTETPMRADLFIVLGGMWIGTFLSALDGTIVATTLSVIGSEFGVSNSIAWLGTSYLMSQTSFQPLYGRFSDIFGRKPATLFASVVFLLGSLACGLSKTYPQLIAARTFAGIGGGGLTTMSSIVTSDLVPLRKRGVYQGLGNVVYALGAAIGGPLGGILGDSIGWRWAFLIQVPICVLHFTIVAWKVDIPSGPGSMREKIKRIDYLGCLSLVISIALLLVGLSLGGNEQPWSAPIVWGSIVAGFAVLVGFVLIETYVAKEPLLAPHILFSRTPLAVSLTNWFASMAQFGIIYQVPLYFSAVEQTTTSHAGLFLIPNAVFASTASLLAGIYMARTGNYRTLLIILGVLGWVGPLLMSFWQRGVTPQWLYWIDMIPSGTGYGGILTISLVALISAVDPKDMAASTGVSYLFRATGSVLGISLSTSILQNSLRRELPRVIKGKHAAEIIDLIRTDVASIRTFPKHIQHAAIGAYQHSFHYVFYAITAAAFFSFLSLLFIKQHALPGRLDRTK